MSDAERKRDRGAFFGSIHRTLNHLVWADSIWLARFTGAPYGEPRTAPTCSTTSRRSRGARKRRHRDARLGRATDARVALRHARIPRGVDGKLRQLPAWIAATHLFHHATHHRGQLTTLMKQAGIDPGVTDLPFLPGVTRASGSDT